MVTVHIIVTAISARRRRFGLEGSARNAVHGAAARDGGPDAEPPDALPGHLVGGNAGGEIADGKDRLVEHQQQDDGAWRDAGGVELRQVDDVNRPSTA